MKPRTVIKTFLVIAIAAAFAVGAPNELSGDLHVIRPAPLDPSFAGATRWLNVPGASAPTTRGKVVLVEFWTYTCINWRRQLPYVRAWAQKYKDLVVIGVHTPEFDFEANADNVTAAAKQMNIRFPIAIDSDHAIWRAFDNHYWPALYFIDAHGRVRDHQFGEGNYEHSERILQQLLGEAGAVGVDRDLVSVEARGPEAAADWNDLRSSETYLGYERTENFTSPGQISRDSGRVYAAVPLHVGQWALSGSWTFGREAIVSNRPHARIVCRFHARDLHLVMGPAVRGEFVRFRVLVDGEPPGAAGGTDLDEHGAGVVTEQRMYQLIRQPNPTADRQFDIEFLDAGVEAFAFTFG